LHTKKNVGTHLADLRRDPAGDLSLPFIQMNTVLLQLLTVNRYPGLKIFED